MPKVYKYTPFVTTGPFGTTITHKNTENNEISLMGAVDGEYYISVPDGVTLPEQPQEITLQEIILDFETREALRKNMPVFRVTRKLADERINLEIGHTSDQIADLAKRIGMVERMVMRMSEHLLQNQPVPETIRDSYLSIVQEYLAAIDVLELRDRVDLESNHRIAKILIGRFSNTAEIVDSLHIQRVRELLGED